MIFILPILVLFLLLTVIPVLLQWQRSCFNNWDLGIYAQALHRITPTDLNPWLSVRQIRIFNDHFDPVLILVSPLAKWMDPSLAAILIETAFILAAALVPIWLWRRHYPVHSINTTLWVALALFHRSVSNALSFPSHPTTWAALAFVLCACSLMHFSSIAIFLSAAALILFKEEMVFSALCLGLYFILAPTPRDRGIKAEVHRNQRGLGVAITLMSVLAGVFIFIIRPQYFGPAVGYGELLLTPWLQDPLAQLKIHFLNAGLLKLTVELLLPFLPLVWWANRQKLTLNWAMLAVAAPLLAIRFLAGKWSMHYGIALGFCLAGWLMPVLLSQVRVSRPIAAATLALLALSQLQSWSHFSIRTYQDRITFCPGDSTRLSEIRSVQRLLKAKPPGIPVYAMGNLIPGLVSLPEIRQYGVNPGPAGEFYLVHEKETGVPYPLTRNDFTETEFARKGILRLETQLDGKFIQFGRYFSNP